MTDRPEYLPPLATMPRPRVLSMRALLALWHRHNLAEAAAMADTIDESCGVTWRPGEIEESL